MSEDSTKRPRDLSSQRILKGAALTGALLAAVALFQNCTQAAQTDQGSLVTRASALGFAYNARFDQVAYMSCSGLTRGAYDASAYFTIRAGAYRTGGFGMTDAFYAATKNLSDADRATMLAVSPLNSNTAIEASIRTVGAVQARWSTGASATGGTDYGTFFTNIGQADVSTYVQTLAPKLIRTLPTSTGLQLGQNRFEGNMMYGYDPSTEASVRSHLNGSSADGQTMLALTFADLSGTSDSGHAKSPGDANQSTGYAGDPNLSMRAAYGRGLTLAFRAPNYTNLSPSFSSNANVLMGVSEIDLLTNRAPTDAAAWSCPTSFQFQIVRKADAAGVGGCPMHPDPAVMPADLQVVRRSLRVEDWWVNMDGNNPCIVPKKSAGDCYGTAATVQYSPSGSCGGATGIPCVAFASICYRTL